MGKRVAICCHGQWGDCGTITSVFKYKNELWGSDCKIVWFASKENWDIFTHSDIEVREFPRGFGYPKMVVEENAKLIAEGKEPVWADWQPLVDWDNRMNKALQINYPELAEFDLGYFPAPHQMTVEKRAETEYSLISKRVFGVPMDWEWHPVLMFSEQERIDAKEFMDNMLFLNKTVAIETFAGSGQSALTDLMITDTMRMCREVFGQCNFVFMSHKFLNGNETFPDEIKNQQGVYFASNFTVRQCALIVGLSDLLVSVSSGITVASSCWWNKPTPIIQFCGSEICSTKSISLGRYELITHGGVPLHIAIQDYNNRLLSLLNEIK